MKYTPPFKVTTKIIDLISKISLNIGKLEAIDSRSTLPMLRKINQIRTITGTLQIEGNTLDEERITALIEGKRVLGKVDEIAEANGAIALYKMLDNLNFKDEKELLKSHKILMDELLKDAGKYRTSDVGVGGKNKDFSQIKDADNSFVVADGIEVGFKNKIPLWLFGFLY